MKKQALYSALLLLATIALSNFLACSREPVYIGSLNPDLTDTTQTGGNGGGNGNGNGNGGGNGIIEHPCSPDSVYFEQQLFGGVSTGYYLWNKPHRNVEAAEADFSVEAADLFAQFAGNEAAANPKYLDKIITVCGTVREVTNENGGVKVQLIAGNEMGGVSCEMETNNAGAPFKGSRVCLKGICTGYLMDVVLNRCVEVKN